MRTVKILSLILGMCAFAFQTTYAQKITGQGPTVKQNLNVSNFEAIGLGLKATVYVTQGPNSVSIEAQQNIIDNIKTDVKNGSWNIDFDKRVSNHEKIVINVSMPNITALAIGGSGEIIARSTFNNLGNLSLSIGGSGTIELSGSAKNVDISIAGSGDVKTGGLSVNNCEISIAGSGDAFIEVNNDLDVSIAGSGDVHYKGTPKVSSSIAGSGSVKSM